MKVRRSTSGASITLWYRRARLSRSNLLTVKQERAVLEQALVAPAIDGLLYLLPRQPLNKRHRLSCLGTDGR